MIDEWTKQTRARLARAFDRTAKITIIQTKGMPDDARVRLLKAAFMRICDHAEKIGWMESSDPGEEKSQ